MESVRTGDYEINADNEARLHRFLEQLAPLLDAATAQSVKQTKASRERAARFRRIAEHFLTAGEDAYGEGEVLSELNAEAMLHYVIVLEAVLTGTDDEKTELTRKIVQRAAIVVGVDDEDRIAVSATVQAAYNARSRYAHGGEAENVDLPALRRVVRDCILARLILGDPIARDVSLGQYADKALLDHALLAAQVRWRISEFWAVIDAENADNEAAPD